jgi:hypothetical protein
LSKNFHVSLGKHSHVIKEPEKAIADVWQAMEAEMIKVINWVHALLSTPPSSPSPPELPSFLHCPKYLLL